MASAAGTTMHMLDLGPTLLLEFVAHNPAMRWPDQLFPPNGGVGSVKA